MKSSILPNHSSSTEVVGSSLKKMLTKCINIFVNTLISSSWDCKQKDKDQTERTGAFLYNLIILLNYLLAILRFSHDDVIRRTQ